MFKPLRMYCAMPILLSFATTCLTCASANGQQQNKLDNKEPATVSQAATVLDLRKYAVPKDAVEVNSQRLAAVHYRIKSTAKEAFAEVKKQLVSMGCSELAGGYETDAYCSSSFEKQGFRISVATLPGSEAGEVNVTIDNHGNVALDGLPRPENAKPQFANAAMAMYQADVTVDAGKSQIIEGMKKAGWAPYGTAGDQLFFRKNAIIVSVYLTADPNSEGKSTLQYSSQLVSAEIPLPPNASNAHYADVTQELYFATTDDKAAVRQFYVDALAPSGWKPTSAELIKVDFEFMQLFRQPDGQLMRLRIREITDEKRLDVRVKPWQTDEDTKEK